MASALMETGTGAFSGAALGLKMGGAPGAVLGAVGGGLLSYFGGKKDRKTEAGHNAQQLELGELEIAARKRDERAARDKEARKKMFAEMLGRYFAQRANPGVA